jgi:hypothetical protein
VELDRFKYLVRDRQCRSGHDQPAFKIDVQGGQVNASGGLCMAGDCRTSWNQVGSPWAVSGSKLTYSGGNIGVGTTNPGARLHVSGGSVLVDNNGTLQWKKAATAPRIQR